MIDPSALTSDAVLALPRHVVFEYFDGSALLLNLRSGMLGELNVHERWIVSRFDGQHSVAQVAQDYGAAFGLSSTEALGMVRTVGEKLLRLQVLRLAEGSWRGDAMGATCYVQNPDVNLRDEDEDGALLFNPDTDRVQLLNSTGLYIWKLCAQEHTVDEIVAAFKAEFDEVPEDQVAADVEGFVHHMGDSGFLGTVERP